MTLQELLQPSAKLSLHFAPRKESSKGISCLRIALKESAPHAQDFDHFLRLFQEDSFANKPLGLRKPKEMVGSRTYEDRVEIFRIHAGGEIKNVFAVLTYKDFPPINFAHYNPLTFFDHFKDWREIRAKELVRAGDAATKAKIIKRPKESERSWKYWQKLADHRADNERDAWIFQSDGYSLPIHKHKDQYGYQVKPNRCKKWTSIRAGFSSIELAYEAGTETIRKLLKQKRASIAIQLKLFTI